MLDKPVFAPSVLTIEEFIEGFSQFQIPDKLQLIHTLQKAYTSVLSRHGDTSFGEEPFDQFYFWGDMLLKDFDEADKYMVNADMLFRDLSHQKEIDSSFDFLTEEQRAFLHSFWLNFEEKNSINKERFLRIWRQLPSVYALFKSFLQQDKLAYEGMLHREVAENIRERFSAGDHRSLGKGKRLVFAGFNALTVAEEKIMSFLLAEGVADVRWDLDDYYFNNQRQEAGKFFREYSQHRILARTFPPDIPSNLKSQKDIRLYGASQPIGQTKLMAQVLEELLHEGADPEDTLIVLPDEKLLIPVLHSISGTVEKLNVTMGFPLTSTPVFNLVELLVELQLGQKHEDFNHRPVVSLLGHPYIVAADPAVTQQKRKEILHENWVNIPASFLRSHHDVYRKTFNPLKSASPQLLIDYVRSVIHEIGHLPSISALDREFCFQFIRVLNRMSDVYAKDVADLNAATVDAKEQEKNRKQQLKSFLRLFRQLLKSEKIPFSGEPLRGLQVMGVLETRSLDFKNVFILSLNEGSFPSFGSRSSYIPYNIRKAYGLPTVDQQDAMHAYLFYRILQRAENVFLFYNSETDDLGQGEMSRYLKQLLYESGIPIEKASLHNDFGPLQTTPVEIRKDDRVLEDLSIYTTSSKNGRTLTPTALNDYVECQLKFYFRYVAQIREPREVEEELDARVLGNFLHKVMELFYQGIIQRKGTNLIEAGDFDTQAADVNRLIDQAFIKNYKLDPDKKVVYEGQRLVVREIVKRFVDRILKMDRAYAPFNMEALERKDLAYSVRADAPGNPIIILGGSIDRADRKGNVVRVVDYKTGKDEINFQDVPSLFVMSPNRNKAAFQTLMYSLLYKKNVLRYTDAKIVPGLMNRLNLFSDDFVFGLAQNKKVVTDATPLLVEFEEGIKKTLSEIYNPKIPFAQTADQNVCRFCSYHQLCYR